VGIYVTSWVVNKIFIYLFIYYIPSTQFWRAKILYYRNYVWNSYDAGSEIVNVSARHVALKRWTVTDKHWKKNNVVSWGSVVTSVKGLPICVKNSWVLTLMDPSVSSALEKKLWVPLSELYAYLFFSDSCSLIGTGTGDGTLLQIGVSQSVNYCDLPSGAASRDPWQQCQAACRRHGPARVVPSCWEHRLESKHAR